MYERNKNLTPEQREAFKALLLADNKTDFVKLD